LALAPITLIDGRVDNPQAAQAFEEELHQRKAEVGSLKLFNVLDYWFTWILAVFLMVGLFQVWHRRDNS
jgi:hypothetical protein